MNTLKKARKRPLAPGMPLPYRCGQYQVRWTRKEFVLRKLDERSRVVPVPERERVRSVAARDQLRVEETDLNPIAGVPGTPPAEMTIPPMMRPTMVTILMTDIQNSASPYARWEVPKGSGLRAREGGRGPRSTHDTGEVESADGDKEDSDPDSWVDVLGSTPVVDNDSGGGELGGQGDRVEVPGQAA